MHSLWSFTLHNTHYATPCTLCTRRIRGVVEDPCFLLLFFAFRTVLWRIAHCSVCALHTVHSAHCTRCIARCAHDAVRTEHSAYWALYALPPVRSVGGMSLPPVRSVGGMSRCIGCPLPCAPCKLHPTHHALCTLDAVHTAHCVLCIALYAIRSPKYRVPGAQRADCTVCLPLGHCAHCALRNLHSAHCGLCSLFSAARTLHTAHFELCTLHAVHSPITHCAL